MRAVRWLLALAALGVGCSADSGGGLRTASLGAPSTATGTHALAGSGAVATGGGAGASGANSGFGNSSVVPMNNPRAFNDAGQPIEAGGCVVGQFCASANPDMGCGTLTLTSKVKMIQMPGNVLIIFDRSLSMNDAWNGTPKWQAAGDAVVKALMPEQDLLTIGAILFPSPNSQSGMPGSCIDPTGITCAILGGDPTQFCNVNPITASDQLNFMAGAPAIVQLQTGNGGQPLYQPVGATPTSEAVAMADMALSSATLTGSTAVILITDGEPNCNWDQNMTVSTVTNWLTQKNIKTYVVGLPGVNGNGPMVLNAIAQAGGTMQYLTPDDGMTLQMKVQEIVASTITSGFDSCEIDLMPATNVPDKLQLVVTEPATPSMEEAVPHDLGGTAGGWTISSDGSHVSLTGGVCNSAKAGKFATLTFKFGCKDIPPIPPAHVS